MKRKLASPREQVTAHSNATDKAIDELYGLEPVFEPDAEQAGSDALTQFVMLSCPYCGEQFETRIDLTNGSCSYVEDCQVCCQPIDVVITLNDGGELQSVRGRRLD